MNEARLRSFIERSPNNAEAHNKLGVLLFERGELSGALGSTLMALALKSNNPNYRANAIQILGLTSGYRLPERLVKVLEDCVEDENVDHQALSMVARNLTENDPLFGELDRNLADPGATAGIKWDKFGDFFQSPLIKGVLSRAIIISAAEERVLTRLRAYALLSTVADHRAPGDLSEKYFDFMIALACQCFNTEYAFAVTAKEEGALEELIARISTGDDSPAWEVVLIAAYRPLHAVQGIDALIARLDGRAPERLAFLLRRQVAEPRQEALLASQMPGLTPIEGDVTEKVRDQYERFPYPRWTGIKRVKPRRFAEITRARFPRLDLKSLPRGAVEILIAGCGTGRQSLRVATTYRNARITAIDLSRASLAFAERRAREENITKISFAQADIMALGDWDKRFDFIDCTGVLHHLAKPLDGWRVLARLLRPDGFMNIALYSERARQDVVAARRFIAEQGFSDTVAGVRAARQAIIALDDKSLVREVMETPDFYSISGLHDFIFNAQEARYTPLELDRMLGELGLEFLGFSHNSPAVKGAYARMFPGDRAQTDLANWDAFEQQNPQTFSAMFQFWCRRM